MTDSIVNDFRTVGVYLEECAGRDSEPLQESGNIQKKKKKKERTKKEHTFDQVNFREYKHYPTECSMEYLLKVKLIVPRFEM